MKNLSARGVLAAVTPPVIVLVLFYSLALHMYWSLGGWPKSIGYRGFSAVLVFHGELQFWAVKIVSVISVFLWPAALVLCEAISKARRFLPYLAIFAFAVLVCLGLMQLAPEPYLNWWRD